MFNNEYTRLLHYRDSKPIINLDREILKNAFNQKDNPNYYYQATDITLIQGQVTQKYFGSFVIHEPIGNDHAMQPTLQKLIESLDIIKL